MKRMILFDSRLIQTKYYEKLLFTVSLHALPQLQGTV